MMGNVQDWTKVVPPKPCFIVDEGKNKLSKSPPFLSSLAPLDDIFVFKLVKDVSGCDFIAVYDESAVVTGLFEVGDTYLNTMPDPFH
jgi:hypothetical protein